MFFSLRQVCSHFTLSSTEVCSGCKASKIVDCESRAGKGTNIATPQRERGKKEKEKEKTARIGGLALLLIIALNMKESNPPPNEGGDGAEALRREVGERNLTHMGYGMIEDGRLMAHCLTRGRRGRKQKGKKKKLRERKTSWMPYKYSCIRSQRRHPDICVRILGVSSFSGLPISSFTRPPYFPIPTASPTTPFCVC